MCLVWLPGRPAGLPLAAIRHFGGQGHSLLPDVSHHLAALPGAVRIPSSTLTIGPVAANRLASTGYRAASMCGSCFCSSRARAPCPSLPVPPPLFLPSLFSTRSS